MHDLRGRAAWRRAAAAAAAALALTVVVAGVSAVLRDRRPASAGAASPGVASPGVASPSAASPGVVAWLDAPATPYVPQPPVTPAPRPAAPPCRGADLRLAGIDSGGATGHTGTFVQLRNDGRSRCTLSGSPTLSGLIRPGTRIRIPAEPGTFFDLPQTQQRPATIDPHEQAVLTIETSYSCDGGAPASTTTYRRVQLRLADGTTFNLADPLGSSCPIRLGSWYRPVPQPAEPPEPWPTLQSRLAAVPPTAHAGQPFDYVIELANTGPADVTLGPCPAYTEALAGTRADYRLNCAAAPTIRAGSRVRFAMRLDLGADQPAGPAKMLWTLHGSTVAVGTLVTIIR